MNRRLAFAVGAALAIALAACGGGGGGKSGGSLPAMPAGAGNANVPAALLVQNYGQAAMTGASYIGPISDAHLNVSVLVHQQNAAGLLAYAASVSNPRSGNFRKFLTPDQIASEFGASQSDYQKVAQYFANNGLAVGGWKQRLLLSVGGSEANMEKAFGTTFGLYEKNGQQFVAPVTQPHFEQVLPVDAVGNIVKYHPDHTYIIVPPGAGAGYSTGYSPSTVRAAFDYEGAYTDGYNGSHVYLGIIGTGPIDTTASGHGDKDLNQFLTDTGTSNAADVTQVDVSPGPVATALATMGNPAFPYSSDFQTPPAVTAPCTPSGNGNISTGCNPEDGEAQLDTQQAASLAPGANVYFYLAYNASDCDVNFPATCPPSGSNAGAPEIGIVESDPEIMQAINDDVADVISISYGGGESQQEWTGYNSGDNPYLGSYSNLEFAELATEGIAVFISSGDDGSAECYGSTTYLAQQCVSYPAGDPNVTSVGGITAPVNAYGQQTAPWIAWGISTFDDGYGATGGSGGGNSETGGVDIPAPSPQASALAGFSGFNGSRYQPDVSMIGDPSTGVAWVENEQWGGSILGIGGTSVAAPQMAAMWADVLSACYANPGVGDCPASGSGHYWRLGNAAPYLYAIYACKSSPPCTVSDLQSGTKVYMTYSQVFYDIQYGDNQMANPNYTPSEPVPGYTAAPGYDEVSGVGVPFAGHLIDALTGLSVP